MALIAIDRYFAISKSYVKKKVFSVRKVVIVIVIAWMYGLLCTTPPLAGFGEYVVVSTQRTYHIFLIYYPPLTEQQFNVYSFIYSCRPIYMSTLLFI